MSSDSLTQQVVLIGNPTSGRGKGAAALAAAVCALDQRGVRPRVLPTERPGHAVELARSAAAAALLLVLGGDGTVRDAAAGLAEAGALESVPVGIVPFGTGNDLARTLGLPRELPAALETALNGRERPLDVWRWNDTHFVNVAGVGLDAAVAGVVNRRFRRLHGTLAYVAGLAVTLRQFHPTPLHLEWPGGEWRGRAWLAAFGNGRCYGGGMQIAPAAEPDDGQLDLVVIEDVSRLELLRQFPKIFSGTHVQHPRVHTFRAPEVHLRADDQDATIDGELIGRAPARITREAARLRVRVPQAAG